MKDGGSLLRRCVGLIVVILRLSSGYSHFRDRIPNGHNVPNPCKPEDKWIGVGHKNIGGSGARNPFGHDFADSGHVWTKDLCEKDSDLDGRTNGEELGDPNCTWSPGPQLPTGDRVTHPGICEPWNDPKCLGRNDSWVREYCQPSEFKCDAIKYSDVQNKTFRIPSTLVPAQETTYMCQIYTLPNDTDYHIIATRPEIDNIEVMHHIVLFGCPDDIEETAAPYKCGMSPNRNCRSVLSLWAPGSTGQCLDAATGIRFGTNGFKKIAIQLHWNNPQRSAGQFDGSGMTLFFTTKLRPNDAGIVSSGQINLWIPPGRDLFQAEEAIYPRDCSERDLRGNIYVTSVLNHMHYLGKHQYLELYRNGSKIKDIAIDLDYNYDNPHIHIFDNPVEVRPGDELRTRCEYSSTRLSHTTKFGPATSDEMCYSFLTYYPKQNLNRDSITNFKSIPLCRLYDNDVYEGCKWRIFPDLTDPELLSLFISVTTHCKLFESCTQSCYDSVQRLKQHPCRQGDIWDILIHRIFGSEEGSNFVMSLQNCECGVPANPPPPVLPITVEQSTCDWPDLLTNNVDHPIFPLFINVTAKCIATGPCLKECIPAVLEARQHRCFQGAEWHYGRRYLHETKDNLAFEFLIDFESCNCQILDMPKTTRTTTPSAATPPSDGRSTVSPPVGEASAMFGVYTFNLIILIGFVGTSITGWNSLLP